jgi:RNA polymerase sigma-70 factor (ECF subfamily)
MRYIEHPSRLRALGDSLLTVGDRCSVSGMLSSAEAGPPATVHELLDPDSSLLVGSAAEPAVFAAFYRRNLDPLLAWLYRQTLDAEVAADLAGEVFAVAIEQRHRFDPGRGPARAWLWGLAGVELRRWRRDGIIAVKARRRLGIPVLVVDDDAIAHVERLLDLSAVIERLRAHLDELPAGERSALELRIFDELSYDEVAAKLGCAPGAARVRVSRALARLRVLLDPSDALVVSGGAE